MNHSAFLNIAQLPEEARNTLEAFYEFLVFKYRHKNQKKTRSTEGRFKDFLSASFSVDKLSIPGREERNER
jgi:hypothetical protein